MDIESGPEAKDSSGDEATPKKILVEQFRRHKSPTFNGAADPLAFKEWLHKLERIFRLIGCTDAQKVQFVEFMFSGDASHWYAPHLVDTEDKKVRRFEQGLNPDISMILVSHRFTSYRKMLERAHAIWYLKTSTEQYSKLFNQPDNRNMGKRKWNGQDKGKSKWQNKKANGGVNANKSIVPVIEPCPKCGKTHRGVCLQGKNVCFRCDKPGHIFKDCPTFTPKKDDNND
ncbi:uncharacterized protein LOC111378068 [Olea europaea var. sylvestris]|uniref:uncharacterized protein LOC111378068 n=1 Tax=Olea europaea var. sylvestris TaxID=158386 RepID=UPI000C1D0855|nr:uncharacterized protein LOC111378068 [Olea europaea var. sylvestris]